MVNFFISYIVPASTLVPIIVFLFQKSTVSRALKVIFAYLVMALVANVVSITLATFGHRNLWLFHVYTILETVFLLFFFIQVLHKRRAKVVVWVLMIAFPLACIINLLFLQKASIFNTYTRSIEAVLIIGASAYYWLTGGSSKESLSIPWSNNPLNWVVSGLLLYFSSALFLFLFSNFLLTSAQAKTDKHIWDAVWGIHGLLVVIMNILFAIGFTKTKNDR